MRADIFHKEALRLARPITDSYRQKTPLRWPVRGRWKASPDPTRHHQKKSYAVYALDLNKVDAEGRHYRGRGRRLEDVYAWGQPFYAMAPGRVVEVRDGNPDNPLRASLKGRAEKHNGVSILHEGGELTWYVHAKCGSIKVKVGDQVEAGQLLGEVGNSGGSAIPHLHVTLVAFNGISVPWTCDDFTLVAEDGTPIRVERAWPREGWTIEVPEQAPR
ncbi:MAG: M23 family metallopeptidase [Planctomycetota bacterium]|nr:MAG: M23 family metallopeptidase [Planctomycetota bacterium]